MTQAKDMKIGVMGGSFNPVHLGHVLLADYLVQFGGLDKVWLMLSPQNPLKAPNSDITNAQRLEMLRIACGDSASVEPCDIELTMPRPNYSIHSLRRLAVMHPRAELHLIIGSDNWLIFDRWREHEAIIREFAPIIYPRQGYDIAPATLPAGVRLIEAPLFDISSTFIRSAIASGHNMTPYLPHGVGDYICRHHLYLTDN